MTILKALKDRIRSMGGETNATNIADAIKDLPKGGSSELPPEVSNAVETHGMGYTTEEPVPAINITWDGDTEGRESFGVEEVFYKVNDKELTVEELVGSTVSFMFEGTIEQHIILNSNIMTEDLPEDLAVVYIEFDSGVSGVIYTGDVSELGLGVSNGTYFSKTYEGGITAYVSSITKPASTKETVHQIDQKYIPSSGGGISTYEFIVNISAESEETMVITEANAAEVISKLENGDTVKFIIKQVENLEAEDYQVLILSMDIMLAKTEGITMIMYESSGWGTLTGGMIDGVSTWQYEGL